jgi:phosphonate transport system permease protein
MMSEVQPAASLPARQPFRAGGKIVEPPWRPQREHILPLTVVATGVVWLAISCVFAQVDPVKFASGLPQLIRWLGRAWPPNLNELDWVLFRALETVAIATVATFVATIIAFPLSVFASRNLTRSAFVSVPVRLFLNVLRGIDTLILALLFVVAVGLGPFAGVLGMILHTIGVIGKLNSEQIETLHQGPIDAARITGANDVKVVSYAVLPAALPNLARPRSIFGKAMCGFRPCSALSVPAASAWKSRIRSTFSTFHGC